MSNYFYTLLTILFSIGVLTLLGWAFIEEGHVLELPLLFIGSFCLSAGTLRLLFEIVKGYQAFKEESKV